MSSVTYGPTPPTRSLSISTRHGTFPLALLLITIHVLSIIFLFLFHFLFWQEMIFNYFWHFKEDIRDLLSKDQSKRLELKERPDTGIYVKVYVIKKLLLMIILLFLAWGIWWPLDQVAWVGLGALGTLCCVLELVRITLAVPLTTQLHTCKWGNNTQWRWRVDRLALHHTGLSLRAHSHYTGYNWSLMLQVKLPFVDIYSSTN